MSSEGSSNSKITKVILVGHTGIDAALRSDHALELVRIHDTFDVLGEVAFPTQAKDNPPIVVVSSEVVRILSNSPGTSTSRLRDFLDALRIANPAVRVIGIADTDRVVHGMDGTLASTASHEEIRRALFEREAAEPPLVEVVRTEPAPKILPVGKEDAIITALLQGRSPTDSALDVIRGRLNDPSIRMMSEHETSSHVRCAVDWNGRIFGYLCAQGAAERDVALQAKWLAGWLALHEQQSQLRQAAFTDHLTGAWNRRYFEKYLEAAMHHARETRQQLTVMIFDIDDFKGYNDSCGHEAGDRILCEIIELLKSVVRPCDRVCRIGGDEFAVVFHDPDGPRQAGSTHSVDVHTLAERFREKVSTHSFPHLADTERGAVGISGGLATFPWDGITVGELIRKADELALRSKSSGKNTISFGRRS